MAIFINAEVSGDREIRAAFERISKVGGNLQRPHRRIALFGATRAGQRLREKKHIRSGRLRKDVSAPRNVRADDHTATWGSTLAYAAIRQLGGTILPRRGKALAIPIARSMRNNSPKDFPRDFFKFIPAKKGAKPNVIGYLLRREEREGRRGRLGKAGELLFVLVRSVKQVGDPYVMFGREEREATLREYAGEYQRVFRGGR